MKVAICDDDVLFLDVFSKQVHEISENFMIETYSDYESFLENLSEEYDLVFMDIDWESEENGIDIAAKVHDVCAKTKIIFVTSYMDRFVQEVFLQKTNVHGILDKPVKQDILERYIRKIRQEIDECQANVLLAKENNRHLVIPVSEIIYIESHNHMVDIVTVKSVYHVYEALKEIQTRLPDEFCRCHRGFLINMKFVQELKKTEVVVNDMTVPIGRIYRQELEKRYLEFLKNQI